MLAAHILAAGTCLAQEAGFGTVVGREPV